MATSPGSIATLFSAPDSLRMPIIIFNKFGGWSLEFGVIIKFNTNIITFIYSFPKKFFSQNLFASFLECVAFAPPQP